MTGNHLTYPSRSLTREQGIGEYTAIESTSSETRVSFKDRRSAEAFFAGVNEKSLPEQEDTLTASWIPNGAANLTPPTKEEPRGDGMEVEASNKEESEGANREEREEREEGEVTQGEMDYEVADESEWIQ